MKTDLYVAQRLTRLGAKARNVIELAARPEEDESKLVSAAKTAAGIGVAGAGAYGIGSYLRGRAMGASRDYGPATTVADHLGLLKLGHQANMGSVARFRKTAGAAIAGQGGVAGTAIKDAAQRARYAASDGMGSVAYAARKAARSGQSAVRSGMGAVAARFAKAKA